jgi:predicted nucleic acid-binding protein
MKIAQLPSAATVFLDANILVYHFTGDTQFGSYCTQLIRRIERQDVQGVTSAHALADVAHRLMTFEVMQLRGWPLAGIAARLRKHHDEIASLSVYPQAVASLPQLRIQVIPITRSLIEAATQVSKQFELLTGDAIVVAVMQANGLTHLASADSDFDRVPGIVRYEPA